ARPAVLLSGSWVKVAYIPASKVEDDLGNASQTWVANVRYLPRSTNQPLEAYPQLCTCQPLSLPKNPRGRRT
ncbi:MAG: hypothetical protein WBE26_14535, partial [Phycisphaerae bacterium]